jgi:hypothetical protein
MMSRTASRLGAVAAGLAAAVALAVAAAPASAGPIVVPLNNWAVYGSLTPKKLNEPVVLPKGSTFNGAVSLTQFIPREEGTVRGKLVVPPFTASLKLVGLVPTNVGVTITEVGEAEGSLAPAPFSECEKTTRVGFTCSTLSVSSKANIGLTAAGVLGIEVPTHCETSEPVLLALSTHLTEAELLQEAHFTGTVTIPPIKCEGLEGLALGTLFTTLMSGPENPYKLGLAPHEPTPPVIEALPPTAVSQVSAQLHANVAPSGEPITECRFEYGTSTKYGTTVPCPPEPRAAEVSASVGGNAHTLRLTGLAEGTTYHYRLVAANSLGTTEAADRTVTTLTSAVAPQYGQCLAKKGGPYADGGCETPSGKGAKGRFEFAPGPAPRCRAAKKGEYTDPGCTTKSKKLHKGKFEKQAGPGFNSSSGPVTLDLSGLGKGTLECQAETGSGQITAGRTASERLAFSGCKLAGSKQCTSEGANSTPSGTPGTIDTNALQATLLGPVVTHAERQVWNELESAEHQPYLAEFGCEGELFRIKGAAVGVQQGDVGTTSASGLTVYAAGDAFQTLVGEVSENGGSSWSSPASSPLALELASAYELATEIKR